MVVVLPPVLRVISSILDLAGVSFLLLEMSTWPNIWDIKASGVILATLPLV